MAGIYVCEKIKWNANILLYNDEVFELVWWTELNGVTSKWLKVNWFGYFLCKFVRYEMHDRKWNEWTETETEMERDETRQNNENNERNMFKWNGENQENGIGNIYGWENKMNRTKKKIGHKPNKCECDFCKNINWW